MKKLLLIALLGCVYGTVINVPDEYATIQEGIDAAVDTDTVLVAQGAYYENLIIDKNITLTSNAIYDDLSVWAEYSLTFGQYELLNDNIDNTVINGSLDTNGEDVQSVIYINSPDECIEPVIFGFTITGGDGAKIEIGVDDDNNPIYERRGGGFYSNNALPEIHYNYIHDNNGTGESPIHSGGGTDIDLNERCEGDIDLSYNFYRDNDALYGNTLSTNGYAGSIDMSNSIFDVYNCPEEEVTPVWVDVEEEVEVDFQYSAGDLCSITEDVWVSPDGDDYLNTGTSASNAFLTIETALALIAPDSLNAITINLTEGTFSPSTTGESFPIVMISNVNLIGQGEEVTILDAEQTDRVVHIYEMENITVSDLTIQNGLSEQTTINNTTAFGGSGIAIAKSNATLMNVTIANNTGTWYGGGTHIYKSSADLTNVTITNNTAYDGGGIKIQQSSSNLQDVTISNNTAESGGGILITDCNPILTNITIINNTAMGGGGMLVAHSNPTLTNIVIVNNTAEMLGGGMLIDHNSIPISSTLTNTIIWNNIPESIYVIDEMPIITYSDIEGGWEGEGNINLDPIFTDPENDDFTLQISSPCIDAGDPNLWYTDLDGTRSDMGVTGGLFILPNFTNHDFLEVGGFGSSIQFNLYNYRQSPITITDIQFNTSSFTTNTFFPVIIEPFEIGIISIDANNNSLGSVEDAMELISEDLPDGIAVNLSVTGIEGYILNGNLSGTYPSATYRISGDLTIASGDTVILETGTKFQFDGEYDFNIYGMLKAIGTEIDSIIFDNFSDEKWRGFTLDEASDETIFEYVRISGAYKWEGGGMRLNSSNPTLNNVTIAHNTANDHGGGMYVGHSSNPTLTHVTISGNTANDHGGGMYVGQSSNPTLTHVTISGNKAYSGGGNIANDGGGMSLFESNPTLIHVTISGNTADYGGGMYLFESNPTLTHVTISGNTADYGGGMEIVSNSNPTMTHVTISGNTASLYGGGMYLSNFADPTLTNSIIWNNIPVSITGNEQPIITYSDIEGGWEGEGNIDLDPLFINPDSDDYTLQTGSPCIDTGIVIENMEYCGSAPDMGEFEYCEELSVASEIHLPIHYSLNAAYPNPFNPVTSIAYSLPQNGNVELIVYNIQGRQVETLINDFQTSGYYSINWNATSYPSGMYLIRIVSGEFTQTLKVVLVK